MRKLGCIVLATSLLAGGTLAQSDPEAAAIIQRMEDQMQGESSRAELTMTIVRPRYTRDMSLKLWSLGQDFAMTLVTAPARDAGTVYLKRDSDIWNYVPNIDRTIKLPPSMMSQSWMGSDFTNDDLVRESSMVEDYAARLLREEDYEGHGAWVLELVPYPDTPVVWGRVLVWVEQEDDLQLRVEYYDQNDVLSDTLTLGDIRMMGGRRLPARMTLTPADEPDQRTVMTYDSVEFGVELSPDFFTRQNMTRVH